MNFLKGYNSAGWKVTLWSLAFAVIPAALLAGDMKFLYRLPDFVVDICIVVMMPGGFFFLVLIGGPHGGGDKVIDAIAGAVLVIVNALFYRLIVGVIVKWRNNRKGVTKLL
jgi:hypothetical protein